MLKKKQELSLFKRYKKNIFTQILTLTIVVILIPSYVFFSLIKHKLEDNLLSMLDEQIKTSVKQSEDEIYNLFHQMASLSSILIHDDRIEDVLIEDDMDIYEKAKLFDEVVFQVDMSYIEDLSLLDITLLDKKGQLFTNWSLNYRDYSFLKDADWVKKNSESDGHISWHYLTESYIYEDLDPTLILTRSILSEGSRGLEIGKLIISINQKNLMKIMGRFMNMNNDFILITLDDAKVILSSTDKNIEEIIPVLKSNIRFNENDELIKSINDTTYLIHHYSLKKPWHYNDKLIWIYYFTDYDLVVQPIKEFMYQLNLYLLLSLVLLIFASIILARNLSKPINDLSTYMQKWSLGEQKEDQVKIKKEIHKISHRHDEIGELASAYEYLTHRIDILFNRVNEEHEVQQRYYYESLRAQINPHFLLNSLTMIRWMAYMQNAENIVEMIDNLSTVLNYTMSRDGEMTTLREEVNALQAYIELQNARYGDAYTIELDIPRELEDAQIIRFILQPLVENAIHHAFDDELGLIEISASKTAFNNRSKLDTELLTIEVKDNGRGFSEDALTDINTMTSNNLNNKRQRLTGLGLATIDLRIKSTYGESYGIEVFSKKGQGSCVRIKHPLIKNEEGKD